MSLENADDELWCGGYHSDRSSLLFCIDIHTLPAYTAHTCFLDGFVEALDEKQFEEATSLTSSACADFSVLNLPSEEVLPLNYLIR